MPRLIDTHTHVNFQAFREDADAAIERSLEEDTWMVNVGTMFDTSRRAVEMAENYSDGVYAAVGLHPIHLFEHRVDEEETSVRGRGEEFNADSYQDLILRSTKVVAIGEFGLDYYRMPKGEDEAVVKKVQEEVLKQHLLLAKATDKPVMIHCRPSPGTMDAYEDVLRIIDSSFPPLAPMVPSGLARGGNKGEVETRFEIHSFTGDWSIAQEFVKRAAYIALNGIVTFDNTGRSEEVVKNLPLEYTILETDAPYLTPVPHRGKRNEPSYVKFVAQKIAEIKGVSVEEVERVTTNNARELFRI